MKNLACFTLSHLLFFSSFCLIDSGFCQSSLSLEHNNQLRRLSSKELEETINFNSLDSSNEIDEIILTEGERLDQSFGFQTNVTITDNENTLSHPENGIIISRSDLIAIRDNSNVKQFREAIRLILAHEKAHQLQYKYYSQENVLTDNIEIANMYECQADILAGKFLIETLTTSSQEEISEVEREEQSNAIVDALQILFDLGTDVNNFSADHPNQEVRRNAVRFGMSHGMITNFENMLADPHLPWQLQDPIEESKEILIQKIDVLPNETLLDWSFRQAKRMTHFNRRASSDIVVVDKNIKWDTSPHNPFVNFDLEYMNVGENPIRVSMEVQCVSVPRNNERDTKAWQKWSVENFTFNLKPGRSYTVSGKLQWVATEELMPSLIFPPDITAPVSCEYINETFDLGTPTNASSYLSFYKEEKDLKDLTADLYDLVSGSQDDFKSLKAGIGKKYERHTQFISTTQLPGSIKTIIRYPQDQGRTPYVVAEMYEGDNGAIAIQLYNNIVNLIQNDLSSWIPEERESHRENRLSRTHSFTPLNNPESTVEVKLRSNTESGVHSVSIYVKKE